MTLRKLLYLTDSLYLVQANMRDSILEREMQILRNLQKMQRVAALEAEGKNLRNENRHK